jgi:ABC-type sugar transport system permease subunit
MRSAAFYRLQKNAAPYIFVAPFVVLFLLFGLYPLIKSFILAFYVTNGPKSASFVGIENFTFLLSDKNFHKALWNTTVYTLASVFLQLPLALLLAMALNSKWVRLRNFFRLSFFAPNLVGQVFVAVLFIVIFLPEFGLLNNVLNTLFGLPKSIKWLQNAELVMPALVLTSLWMYVGFNMIYFLAALQNVDQNLYEAAMVDGANAVQRFFAVTLPGIKPVLIFVLVIATIGSFQLFELPFVMLQQTAGPDNAGLTVVMYLYLNGFESGDLGYASTVGWTMAFILLTVSLVQLHLSGTFKREKKV